MKNGRLTMFSVSFCCFAMLTQNSTDWRLSCQITDPSVDKKGSRILPLIRVPLISEGERKRDKAR